MTPQRFAEQLVKAGLLTSDQVDAACSAAGASLDVVALETLARRLVKDGRLTKYQAQLAASGKSGQLVFGSYVVLEQLGQGGMGTVYKARHRTMKRDVALKVISPAVIKDEVSRKRFQREVEAAAQLTHPNIVTAHDAGEVNGTHFLVMELVKGADLKSTIRSGGVMSPAAAVDCVIQTARGLAFAHGRGIVHRDIKPANLLLDETGTIKILDMGLARFEEAGQDHVSVAGLTGTGVLMGTVDFMSPEQAIDSKTADARSDLYSLGCTLYYLLTGRAVFEEDTVVKRLMAHQTTPPPRLPLDDEELQRIFEKSLSKRSDQRHQTAQELIDDLEAWKSAHASGAGLAAVPPRPAQTPDGTSSPSVGGGVAAASVAKSVALLSEPPQAAIETTPSASPVQQTQSGRKSLRKSPSDSAAASTRTAGKLQTVEPAVKSKKKGPPARRRGWIIGLAAGGLALVAVLGVLLLRVKTPVGTIVIETSQADLAGAEVSIDERQTITLKAGAGQEAIEIKADEKEHLLKVTKGGFETFTQKFTVKGGESQTITVRLEPATTVSKSAEPTPTPMSSESIPMEPVKVVSILDDPALPAVDAAAERKAVETFLTKMTSGRLHLRLEDNSAVDVTETLRELPPGRFAVEELLIYEGAVSAAETTLLRGCHRIRQLNLPRGCVVTAEMLDHISQLSGLQDLNFSQCQMDSGLWSRLKALPKLRVLGVGECRFPSSEIPSIPEPLKTLEVFGVSDSRMSEEVLVALAPGMPNLVELQLPQDDGEELRTLAVLRHFPKVTRLLVSPNQLNEAGVRFISEQGVVNQLVIHGRVNDQVFQNLLPLKGQLKQLGFFNNKLTTTPPTRRSYEAIANLSNLDYFAAYGNQGCPDDFSLKYLASLPKLQAIHLQFPEQSGFPEFPDARLLVSNAGLDEFRRLRPDVRLDVNGKSSEPTAQAGTVAIPAAPALVMEPPAALPTNVAVERLKMAGTLAPADQRLTGATSSRPAATPKLRAGTPLSESAAVTRPAAIDGVLSWSIESITPRDYVEVSALSSQGVIATGSSDCLVRLWNDRFQLLRILPGHRNGVHSVCFSPDGTRLVSIANDPAATVAMWDVESGQLLWTKPVRCWGGRLTWSPNGQRIALCEPNQIDLLNPETGQIIAQVPADKYPMEAAWSSDSQRLCVVIGQDARVLILDGTSLAVQREFVQANLGRNTDAAWSDDGRWLAISSENQVVIYDAATFGNRATIDQRAYSVAFSSDNSQLAIAYDDGTSVYNTSDWSKRWQTPGNSGCVQWSRDGKTIVSARNVMDSQGAVLSTLHHIIPRVLTAASPDGSRIATMFEGGLRVWDGNDGSLLHDIPKVRHENSQLLWNPAGDRLLRLGRVEAVNRIAAELIDPTTGESQSVLNGHEGHVWRSCWSPGGEFAATVGDDGHCIVWDAKSGQQVRAMKHTEPQWWVQWSSDEKYIGCASQTVLTIWNAKTGEQVRRFATLSGRFYQPGSSFAGDAPFTFMKDSNLITCLGKSEFEQLDVRSGKITPLGAVTAEGSNYGTRFTCQWSPDFKTLMSPTSYRETEFFTPGSSNGKAIRFFVQPQWLADSRRVIGGDNVTGLITGTEVRSLRRFGVLIPEAGDRQWMVISPEGHYRASDRAGEVFAAVAVHTNGSIQTHSLEELTSAMKWENDPAKVRLLKLR